jgi:peptidoglycan/xylan/chitin deacetylase (PgdA/CDA1 family)
MPTPHAPGALVISLDFELLWGVRDVPGIMDRYAGNLHGVRRAVPGMLRLFADYGVAATWATVGLLFASGRAEAEAFSPAVRPRYADPRLDAYQEPLGDDEASDPLHFAPGLVAQIRATPRQEMATHTFSHYYCLEPGQDRAAFDADLASAVRIAEHGGVRLRSIVFHRNQHNPAYDDVLRAHRITCYRGAQPGWMHGPGKGTDAGNSRAARAARLLDAHLGRSAANTTPWAALRPRAGLSNVPAGSFLRPVKGGPGGLHRLHVARITRALAHAARRGEVFHLWWHPHNFGARTEENLAVLRGILDHFARWRQDAGMLSLGMAEAAEHAAAGGAA